MIFPALMEAAQRDELLLIQDGFCRFHLRLDGVVVIHEIIVLPCRQRTGLGTRMVALLVNRFPNHVFRARCPVAYESNAFWESCEFKKVTTVNEVNVWEFHP